VIQPPADLPPGPIGRVPDGGGTVQVSRVLYGWADQPGLGTQGMQFLASTPDLEEAVRDRHLDGLLEHRDLYLNLRPVDLPEPLVVLGMDVVADRWCVFRKQPAENAPTRHLVEFLLAPPGVALAPSDALVWADRHSWITRTDGPADLSPAELHVGDPPRFDGLDRDQWWVARAVLLHLLESPRGSLAVAANPVQAEEVFRFVFAALPSTISAGVTFSTFDSTQSRLQVAATPLARGMHGRQVVETEPTASTAPSGVERLARFLERWRALIEAGPSGVERLRAEMAELRGVPVGSLAELSAYLAVEDGTAGHGEVVALLAGPLSRTVVGRLGRQQSSLGLLVDAVAEHVGQVERQRELDELQQWLVAAAQAGQEHDGATFGPAFQFAVRARASTIRAMGPALNTARRRQLAFLTQLVDRVATEQEFDAFVVSVFGNGVGAPPEIRSLVLRRLLGYSDESASLRTRTAGARPDELTHWWVVPTDDLPELLDRNAPELPEDVRLRLVQESYRHEHPTPSAWLRFARSHMTATEVRSFLEWLDPVLAEFLSREPCVESDGRRLVEPEVLNWFLDSGDLTPEVTLRVIADARMAASPLCDSIVDQPDRLLRALFRGSSFGARLSDDSRHKRRRGLFGGPK
jgi:hypothetical protein